MRSANETLPIDGCLGKVFAPRWTRSQDVQKWEDDERLEEVRVVASGRLLQKEDAVYEIADRIESNWDNIRLLDIVGSGNVEPGDCEAAIIDAFLRAR